MLFGARRAVGPALSAN